MTARKASVTRTFSQAEFDAFAALSGDDNPIHVDPAFAARTRFGRTVAHGAMLCAVLRGLVEQLEPGGRQIRQSVTFPAPTYAGEPMIFEAEITEETPGLSVLALRARREADGQETCTGDCEVAR